MGTAPTITSDLIHSHTTVASSRDAGPVEILLLEKGGRQRSLATVAAERGVVVTLEGDANEVQRLLQHPLQLDRHEIEAEASNRRPDLISDDALRRLRDEVDGPGRSGKAIFIDGRIDGAGWVEALPLAMTGSLLRARRTDAASR